MFKDFRLRKIAFLVLPGLLATLNVRAELAAPEGPYPDNLRRLANVSFDSYGNDRLYETPLQEEPGPAQNGGFADINVQFKSVGRSDSSIYPRFRVKNIGNRDLNLDGLALRYWFNCDCTPGTTAFEGAVDWAGFMPSALSIASSKLQISFERAMSGHQTHVMVVRFVGDSPALAPGQSVEIHARFNRKDWGSLPPVNDWSYSPFSTYTGWQRVAGYIDGNRVWGQEP